MVAAGAWVHTSLAMLLPYCWEQLRVRTHFACLLIQRLILSLPTTTTLWSVSQSVSQSTISYKASTEEKDKLDMKKTAKIVVDTLLLIAVTGCLLLVGSAIYLECRDLLWPPPPSELECARMEHCIECTKIERCIEDALWQERAHVLKLIRASTKVNLTLHLHQDFYYSGSQMQEAVTLDGAIRNNSAAVYRSILPRNGHNVTVMLDQVFHSGTRPATNVHPRPTGNESRGLDMVGYLVENPREDLEFLLQPAVHPTEKTESDVGEADHKVEGQE